MSPLLPGRPELRARRTPRRAPGRRALRGAGLVGVVATAALVATACFPSGPVETWVPDYNRDGRIEEAEVAFHKQSIINEVVAAVEAERRAVQAHPFLVCVRAHESDRAGGYLAQNPRSSASGAYQFLDSTWRNASARAGYPGYAKARHAPWWVQDAVALHLVENGGRSAWAGTGC